MVRRLIITLPAYNEESTLESVLDSIVQVMSLYARSRPDGLTWRIVVVDDASTDHTASVAEAWGAMVVRLPSKSGLAAVFRQEIQTALDLGAEWIVHLDSDGQHPPQAIPDLLAGLETGADLVIGSRFLNQVPTGKPRLEQFESRSFSRLLSWITGGDFTDVHCGFRAFTRQIAREIPIRSSFSYTREQIFRAAVRGYRIEERPIVSPARQDGSSRLIKNRYHTMLGITRRLGDWSREEHLSLVKLPVIIGWGWGTVAISWLLRTLYSLRGR